MTEQATQQERFESFAIIELFGHQQIAGKVTEAQIGGCSFIRVDVPEMDGSEPYTKFFGNGAIYSMTPVTETVARAWLQRHRQEAINVWGLNLAPKALNAVLEDCEDEEL